MIEPILLVAIVIICTVWATRWILQRRARHLTRRHAAELEVLGKRYASGEIGRDEYLQKRSDILGYPLVSGRA
jgi:putative membrane protein